MTEKELIAEKQINKLEIDGKTYLRVFHHLSDMRTGASLFILEEDASNLENVYVTESLIDDVPEDVRGKLTTNEYLVEVTEEDKEMIVSVFQAKWDYLKKIADKHLTVGFKRRLLQFFEVGGHYFGYVYEEGMPYNKLYHLIVDPSNESINIKGVPPDLLPALIEGLSSKILDNLDEITIQVDDGVYAKITKTGKGEGLTVVVAQALDHEGNSSMHVAMAFLLKRNEKDGWFVKAIKEGESSTTDGQIAKSFETVCFDLLSRVYANNPEILG